MHTVQTRCLLRTGDFGSNADSTFADAFPDKPGQNSRAPNRTATNWHQNLQFVWSIVRQNTAGSKAATRKKLVFYLSDIHLRGGGGQEAAMAPPNTSAANISAATTDQDAFGPCAGWLSGGLKGCHRRLQDYMSRYKPKDYEKHDD